MSERSKITHVAIRLHGKIYSLPGPNRHNDIITHLIETTGIDYPDLAEEDKGFLDETGRYLNRKQALVSALIHDQVKDPSKVIHHMLTSDDLW